MATTSEVKAGLDAIAASIATERQALKQCQARIATAKANLTNIPTQYADLITTIDGYAGGDAFEDLSQAEKAKLQTEFTSLKTKATTADTAVAAIDFSD